MTAPSNGTPKHVYLNTDVVTGNLGLKERPSTVGLAFSFPSSLVITLTTHTKTAWEFARRLTPTLATRAVSLPISLKLEGNIDIGAHVVFSQSKDKEGFLRSKY